MLIVKTKLREFPKKGIGLVADENIKKEQAIWTFNPLVDIKIMNKNIPREMREFYDKYAIRRKNYFYLNSDNARFINHSKKPNIKSLGKEKDNIALRDIKRGEEITIDYEEIEGPIDFKDCEVEK